MRKLQASLICFLIVLVTAISLIVHPAQAQTSVPTVAASAAPSAGATLAPTAQLAAPGQTIITSGIWPRALGSDGTNLWIANGFDNTVMQYSEDAVPKPVGTPVPVGASPTAMAWDSNQHMMWVTGYDDLSLTVIDAKGKVVQTISAANGGFLDGHPIAITFAGTFMWVLTQNKDVLWKVNTATLKPDKKIPVGNFPTALTASPDGKHLWVTNGNDDSVTAIDAVKDGGSAIDPPFTASIPAFPIGLTFDGAFIWVANYEGKMVKLDAVTGTPVTTKIDVNPRPVAIFYNKGHVWVANADGAVAIDIDSQANAESDNDTRKPLIGKTASYAGAVVATSDYLYLADWLNDRVVRVSLGSIPAIAIKPTAPPSPTPTNTPLPPTATQCPWHLEPHLQVGEIEMVRTDDNNPKPLRVHQNAGSDQKVLAQLPIGTKFKVLAGPICLGQPSPDKKSTWNFPWWQIQTLDSSGKPVDPQGFIIEGEDVNGASHYFVATPTPSH